MSAMLTDEQQAIRDSVRRFVREEIRPLELALDTDASELDPANLELLKTKTKQMGLYNYEVPEEFGGPGVDIVTQTLIAIEKSQHRAGLYSACYGAFGNPPWFAALTGANDEQRERYFLPLMREEITACFGLSEPSGGSDPARAIRTRAVRDGDDWIINGSKMWISNSVDADICILFARTGEPGSGRSGITCFIVETDWPGFYVRRIIHTIRAGHPATELQFEGLRVPHRNVLGEVGNGFALANEKLSAGRIPYSAQCIGVAVRAQELAVEYAKQREVFGKTIAEHQGAQWMLVDSEMDIRTATLLTLQAASRADLGLPYRTESAIAKIVATEAAGRVVDRAIQIHGGMGVAREMPLERWYRELRIRRVGEGATEVQKMIIGRELANRPYRFFLD